VRLRRGIDRETRETFQLRLWALVVALVLILAYIVAFIAENNANVGVHFVLFTAHTSVIWLILLSLLIGAIGGLLLSQLYRRGRRNERG
jgi:uncharacterized integral membrane protein